MSVRFEENDLHILNYMQYILLNDDPKRVSFEEVSKVYGFDEDTLVSETSIFDRKYKASNN